MSTATAPPLINVKLAHPVSSLTPQHLPATYVNLSFKAVTSVQARLFASSASTLDFTLKLPAKLVYYADLPWLAAPTATIQPPVLTANNPTTSTQQAKPANSVLSL